MNKRFYEVMGEIMVAFFVIGLTFFCIGFGIKGIAYTVNLIGGLL